MTECITNRIVFQASGRRNITADFSGGTITSDAGVLLFRRTDERIRLLDRFADCFTDHRNPGLIEHSVRDLVAQRVFAIALGYEDLNDHDDLSRDPLLAAAAGKSDPTGVSRKRKRDILRPLATRSTLNRLELTPASASPASRYKKVVYDAQKIEALLLDLFLEAHNKPPTEIVIDLDATDDTLYGKQEGRFFHGQAQPVFLLSHFEFSDTALKISRRAGKRRPVAATSIVICRCMRFAAGICLLRGCAPQISTLHRAAWICLSRLSCAFASGGRRLRSSYAATAGFAGKK